MDIFEFINNAFTKRKPVKSTENQLKETDSYFMVCRWLSMSGLGLSAAYLCSKFSKLPKWAMGCFLYHKIKKHPTPQLDYIKKEKEEKNARKEEVINKLMRHYFCSRSHAEQMIEIYKQAGLDPYTAFGIKNNKK